jgi:hypothetical protein
MTKSNPKLDEIWVVGYEEGTSDRALWNRKKVGMGGVSPGTLQTQFQKFVGQMYSVLADVPAEVGGFSVDEVQLTAEVSAKGTVNMLGTGGEVGGSGGITITFRRAKS